MRLLGPPAAKPVTDGDARPDEPAAAPPAARRSWPTDVLALLSYAALALYVTSRLWIDPAGRVLMNNRDDHGFFLFVMAHGERVVFHGASPLYSDRIGVPTGVNMMANTSMLAASIPLAPVTHLFGPGVAVVLLLMLGLSGTAAAWYWVLSRHLVDSRAAAWIGGLWGGFAPGWISHASGQVNFVNSYAIPFIVWQVLRLREPGRIWRGGVTLGLLAVLQIFINEESLLFAAIALALFVLAYTAMNWRAAWAVAPRFLAGGLVAVGVALVLLAYPLYFQFFGPGHYRGQPFVPDKYTTSLLSIFAYPRQSIAGNVQLAKQLSGSPTEDNTFWGPAGFLMILVSVAVLWRSVAARAATLAGLVLLIMSFGPHLRFTTANTTIPTMFGWTSHVPVLDLVTVPRYALASTAVAGVLLALATDRVRVRSGRLRILFRIGLVLALVPLVPKPLPIEIAHPIPAFFTQQLWRGYVQGDRTVVMVPLPDVWFGRDAMRVAALGKLAFPVPRGYFMGPKNPPQNDTGSWYAPRRYTVDLLHVTGMSGAVPPRPPGWRDTVLADLRYWRAAVVVLLPKSQHQEALENVLIEVLGQPQHVGGVELWDVRGLR